MKAYIFTITYNFDGGYVIKKYDTYEESIQSLSEYLKEEVQIVRTESEYEPSVLHWGEDDVTIVYAEGYTTGVRGNQNKNYAVEDCAYYRVFEVEI